MKKKIFIIISSQYFFKYITLKSFKLLEKKYNVHYLFNEKKLDYKNIKIKNKIFYTLNKQSSVRSLYLLNFLRISNHNRCRTFKAVTEWYYPNYRAFKQMFKQDNLKSFYLSYSKIFFKKLIMNLFSIKLISNFMANFFYKKIKIEKNLNEIFLKYKPDLVLYPTHSWEPEVLKIKKLSDIYKFKTFYIIDNWDNLTTKTYYKFKPDYIGVWGKQVKKHAVSIQNFKKEKVFTIGNCRFDNYFKLKKENFKKINYNYILFLAANIRVDETYYLTLLNKILRKNKKIFKNTKIIYRQHPQSKDLTKTKNFDDLENVIIDKSVFTDNQVPYFKNDFRLTKKNYIPLILNARFITGCATSIVVEGLIFNKSYLVIAFKKQIDEYFNPKWSYESHIHYEGLEKVDNVNFSSSEKQYEKKVIQMFKNKKVNNFAKTKKQLKYFYHKDKLPYDKKIKQIVQKILV
tara:strand:- start:46785 stop:48161 length:1377 start_codon:yes stop_codon:yes gene_type:complete